MSKKKLTFGCQQTTDFVHNFYYLYISKVLQEFSKKRKKACHCG